MFSLLKIAYRAWKSSVSTIIPVGALIIYSLFGGAVFWLLEYYWNPEYQETNKFIPNADNGQIRTCQNRWTELVDEVMSLEKNMTLETIVYSLKSRQKLFKEMSVQFETDCLDFSVKKVNDPPSLASLIYFAGILYTTIGYGDISPKTVWGRLFMCLYATIGIPLTGYALGIVGNHCARVIVFVHHFLKTCRKVAVDVVTDDDDKIPYRQISRQQSSHTLTTNTNSKSHSSNDVEKNFNSPTSPPKTTHAAEKTDEEKIDIEAEDFPFFVAILVCFIWIAIGAMFFSLWEKWNYGVALYFMYQSLTTIGLGDITPILPACRLTGFIILIIGLSLVSMSLNLIALKLAALSRRMRRTIHDSLADIGEIDDKDFHVLSKVEARAMLQEKYLRKENGILVRIMPNGQMKEIVNQMQTVANTRHRGVQVNLINAPSIQRIFVRSRSPSIKELPPPPIPESSIKAPETPEPLPPPPKRKPEPPAKRRKLREVSLEQPYERKERRKSLGYTVEYDKLKDLPKTPLDVRPGSEWKWTLRK